MELILINSSKLKIMLTDDEMKKYDLDTDIIDYDTTSTRRAFWSILDDAKTRTGFDAASDRVFIQLYPSKKGGCEMYVTKLGEKSRASSHPTRSNALPRKTVAFSFPSAEALVGVCRRLLSLKWRGESRAFCDDKGQFFLTVTVPDYEGLPILHELSFVTEYGSRENADRLALYISEHGRCLCEKNAVASLGVL